MFWFLWAAILGGLVVGFMAGSSPSPTGGNVAAAVAALLLGVLGFRICHTRRSECPDCSVRVQGFRLVAGQRVRDCERMRGRFVVTETRRRHISSAYLARSLGPEHRYEIGPTNCGHGGLKAGDVLAFTRDFDRDFSATRDWPKGCGCVFNFFAASN